jgi:hypothetical protein
VATIVVFLKRSLPVWYYFQTLRSLLLTVLEAPDIIGITNHFVFNIHCGFIIECLEPLRIVNPWFRTRLLLDLTQSVNMSVK